MNSFINRYFISHFFLFTTIIGVLAINQQLGANSNILYIIFPLEIALSFVLTYLLDKKFIPKRKQALAHQLTKIFKATPVATDRMKFHINGFDVYTEAEVKFSKELAQIANGETIRFHIPRHQMNLVNKKTGLVLKRGPIPRYANLPGV